MAEKDVSKTNEKAAALTKTEEMQAKIAAAKKAKAEAEAAGKPAEKKPATKKTAVEKNETAKPTTKKSSAKEDEVSEQEENSTEKGSGNATGLRIGAAVLWVAAIAFEVVAVLLLFGKISITAINTLTLIIIALVLDLICVSIGSLLWKKSNRIDPASKKNKVKFWLWNNMGLIVTAFAFVPFIILSLTNKNADKKTKTIATVVAVIALLIGGLVGYDWNPISPEEKTEAENYFADDAVYWTQFGTVYHVTDTCSHINNHDNIKNGTVTEAIESNKTRLCKDCAKEYGIELDGSTQKSDSDDIYENTDTLNENADILNENGELELPDDAEAISEEITVDEAA